MLFLFADTNIFLQCTDFDQVDWKAVCNTDQEVVIVLAPIVISELDKHKQHPKSRISKRVRRLLPKIEVLIEAGSDQIRYLSNTPTAELFTAFQLDRNNADDNLIASMLDFKNGMNQNDTVSLCTNDTGPRLKAIPRGIVTVKMPDHYLLAEEPDEMELQNRQLQKELDALKNRMPKLRFNFINNSTVFSHQGKQTALSREAFIESEIQKQRSEKTRMFYFPPDKNASGGTNLAQIARMLANSPFHSISEDQVINYNTELDKYFEEYKQYASRLYSAVDIHRHIVKLEFVLHNEGTAPAEDIDIEMHFPDGFELLKKDALPKYPSKPEAPRKPKNRMDILSSFSLGMEPLSLMPNFNPDKLIDLGPTITKTNSYDVGYHFKDLKHHQQIVLVPLYARFESIHRAKGFTIDYRLKIANLPSPLDGQLHVKFED